MSLVTRHHEQCTRRLQACLWDLRRLIEGELQELTEAQQRLDTFLADPTAARLDAMALNLDERCKTLVRTNEQVLHLLYDACAGTQQLSEP